MQQSNIYYLVGGAVRDKLLGLEPKDHDYVVVGGTPSELLAKGFTQVGLAFPVFLHPQTGDEYALARRERKVAPGYGGFEVEFGYDVTLEEDLARRDLTINSMAMDVDGNVIDPYGGQHDLANKVLRHTTEAFAEDPLRVLRLARFVARYNYNVAEETVDFCRKMIVAGELDHLVSDRVWVEIDKMLGEVNFHKGVEFLKLIGALDIEVLKVLCVNNFDLLANKIKIDDLTRDERAFFFTAISRWSHEQLNTARVPTTLSRKVKLFDDYSVFKVTPMDSVDIVRFFDKYRNELSDVTLDELDHMMLVSEWNDFYKTRRPFINESFRAAIKKLQNLDFTDLVKGIQSKDIKRFVFNTKVKTLEEMWARNQH